MLNEKAGDVAMVRALAAGSGALGHPPRALPVRNEDENARTTDKMTDHTRL